VSQGNYRLTPARRIQLKRAGVRLGEIIARLAALDQEYRKLNLPPRPGNSR